MADEALQIAELQKKLNDVTGKLGELTAKTKKAAVGIGGVAATFMTSKPEISGVLGQFGDLGQAAAPIVKHLEKQTDMYRNLSRGGVHFSGRMQVASEMAVSAGLDMKQFGGVVEQNTELFAGMGGTAQAGAQAFFTQLEKLRLDDAGAQMRALGISYEEQAENMAIIQNFENMSMRSNRMNDAERNAATLAFSTELDLLSKLTGKQSDELKKGISEMQRAGDFKALQMDMSADMAAALTTGAEEAKGAGIGDLFKDMMIRGFPSRDQAKLAGLYGNSMKVMQKMKAAQDKGNVHEYNRLKGQLAAAAIQDQMANKDLAKLGGTTAVTQIASQAMADSGAYHTTLRNMYAQRARELGVARLDAAEVAKLEAEARAKTKEEAKAQVAQVPNEVVGAMIAAQDKMVDIGAKMQKEATVKLYDNMLTPGLTMLMTKVEEWDPVSKLDEAIASISRGIRQFTPGASGGGVPVAGAESDMVRSLQGHGGAGNKLALDLQRAIDKQNSISGSGPEAIDAREKGNEAIKALMQKGQAFLDKKPTTGPETNLDSPLDQAAALITAAVDKFAKWVGDLIKGPGSAGGSPGMQQAVSNLNSLAQNWGTGSLGMLHGEEAVVTKKQLAMIDASFNELFARTSSLKGFSSIAQPGATARPAIGKVQGAVNTMSQKDPNRDLKRLGIDPNTGKRMEGLDQNAGSLEAMMSIMTEMKDAVQQGDQEGVKDMQNALNEIARLGKVSNALAGKHLRVGKGMMGDIFSGGPRL